MVLAVSWIPMSSFAPWDQCPLVLHACFTIYVHYVRSCVTWLSVCVSWLHQSLTSSSHSLAGLPLFDVSSIIQNTVFLISLSSVILHVSKHVQFPFDIIVCSTFFLSFNLLLISSFVILCCYRMLKMRRYHFISHARSLCMSCFFIVHG